jgi:hypothetical protein
VVDDHVEVVLHGCREIDTYWRSVSTTHHDEIKRRTSEQYSSVLLNIRTNRKLSLSLDNAVSWDVIDIGGSLYAIACKALLLRVVVSCRHDDCL